MLVLVDLKVRNEWRGWLCLVIEVMAYNSIGSRSDWRY